MTTDLAVGQSVDKIQKLLDEVGKRIIGQEDVLEQVLIAVLAGGHALLEGVPGLGKTLLIKTLADCMALDFRRIQFTPDLMPSDILGTEVLEEDHTTGRRSFQFVKGPIFTQLLLADEINRTPPKTQAALLEAMQEHAITYAGKHYTLPAPFFVLATQNPIEQAGTYPLPEAQLDRFLLYITMRYPTPEDEQRVLAATTGAEMETLERQADGEVILELRNWVRQVHLSEPLLAYVNRLVRATRPDDSAPQAIRDWVQWGAGTRAGQALILTAKARALIKGRYSVLLQDLQALALPVLRHRLLLNYQARADRITADKVVTALLEAVPAPESPLA